MASVTHRIGEIKQPYGGYLPVKSFAKEQLDDGIILHETENIHAGLVGLAVDYLTRYMLNNSVDEAFHISTLGAQSIGMVDKATALKKTVSGLDDQSIIAACKLSGFDVCYRVGVVGYRPIEGIMPDAGTIENIRTMVKRSMSFWEKYGPIVCSEMTFEGGYTATVNTGDGDFITQDTLWDFKVSKSLPNSKQTLQLLMYYVMGKHSVHEYYRNVKQLGIFNPRLNLVYVCPISVISPEIIKQIEEDVICYGKQSVETTKDTAIERPKKPSVSAKKTEKKEIEYSVADICDMTGMSKNVIYDAIKKGQLIAHKKGNKYVISQYEYFRYVQYVEEQKKMAQTLALAAGVAAGVFIIVLFIIMFL